MIVRYASTSGPATRLVRQNRWIFEVAISSRRKPKYTRVPNGSVRLSIRNEIGAIHNFRGSYNDSFNTHPRGSGNAGHPIGIAPGEIVVDRNNVNAFAFECVQVAGQRSNKRLPSPVFISAIRPRWSVTPPIN